MKHNILDRLLTVLLTSIVAVTATLYAGGGFRSLEPEASFAQVQVQNTLVPRFINFDIGTMTLRSGAVFQQNPGIPTLAPYVQFPNSGGPLLLANFTLPPDYAQGGDITVRILWSTSTDTCFHVLQADLVGYGPGHPAASFDVYWEDATTADTDAIIMVEQSYSTWETFVTFKSYNNYPAYPGDAMKFMLRRMAEDINDTCVEDITIRSVSVIYQGQTTYLPLVQN